MAFRHRFREPVAAAGNPARSAHPGCTKDDRGKLVSWLAVYGLHITFPGTKPSG
jgi:hypothetical protein